MKKIVGLVLVMMLVVCGCSAEVQDNADKDKVNGKELFTNSDSCSHIDMSVYDGESISEGILENEATIEAIIKKISTSELKEVDDWTTEKAEFPIYSLYFEGGNADKDCIAWCNGYLFSSNGKIYSSDFDFTSIQDCFEWREQKLDASYAYWLPCIRYIIKDDAGWNNKVLKPVQSVAKELPVSGKFVEIKDNSITVELTNNSDEFWSYGWSYGLRVMIDEQWYDVPTTSPDGMIVPLVAIGIEGRTTQLQTYKLTPYGDLPAGKYMIIIEDLEIPFEIN